MNIESIIKSRKSGQLQISFSANWGYPLSKILEGFGLFPEAEKLEKVSLQEAKAIVETLLWKDLAYGVETMPLEAAREYADYLFAEAVPEACQFYTNASWQKYHESNAVGFTPFTSATFDGGILAVSENMSFLFWVRDED